MNHYNEVPGLLETGCELVSPHLRWLIRNAVLSYCPPEAVNLIAYNENVPNDNFGIAHGPSRSISINLERHFFSAMDRCVEEENMYASLRLLLLHEILDTVLHEAHHLKVCSEHADFNSADLDEPGAIEAGKKLSWMVAKKWDCNISIFGQHLDALLNDFLSSIEEDTKEKPTMWKDLQVWMNKKNLGYYNPDKDLELSISHAFEALSKDEEPWLEEAATFLDTTIQETEQTQPTQPIVDTVPVETYNAGMPVHPAMPQGMEAVMAMMAQMAANNALVPSVGDEYPEYQEDPYQEPVVQTPVLPVPVLPAAQPDNMAKTIETVFRTIFWHVISKGGFTHEGTYNNPGVVMEPVSIAHIPGASQIFTHMDTLDAHGKFVGNQPITMGITGMVAKGNLPKYTLFLRINGELHRRTLLAQNPNSTDDNGQLKTWAREARAGAKIMFILGDEKNGGVRAKIKLDAGKQLGQEEYSLWNSSKQA